MSLFQHVYNIANRFPVRIVNMFEDNRYMSKNRIFVVAFFAQMTFFGVIFAEFRIKSGLNVSFQNNHLFSFFHVFFGIG